MVGHSSGGFGGGHSSGGFSGGGRSSGGFSSGGGRSSFGGSDYRGPGGFYGGWMGPGWGPRPPKLNGYNPFSFYTILIIMIIIIILAYATTPRSSVPSNKTQRTALSGVVNKTDWYEDNLNWITNKNVLISGLEDFYKKTGIQPYILFVSYSPEYWIGTNINATSADNYLEKVYAEKFTDEAHFIFAYFACSNDTKSEMDGEFRYLSGYSADTIMDSEAISILWGYFEKNYYDTSLSIEKMISNTFSETAKSIMSAPTNGWDFAKILFSIIGIIVVVWIFYLILKAKNKRAKEKEEYTKDILNKPLETFGTDTSDLEDKYK